ncbi:MAG: 16S rRNA (adenine(1518)-N(6)/adenine(1519)-N(6))-dimethyltransferase RsmA [Candidatus Micrarchaeota archaeon]
MRIGEMRINLKKSFGQHFLNDKNIIAKEVRLLEVKNKTVLEIGAGDGRLTKQLLSAGAKKIIAVEKDRKMITVLNNLFEEEKRIKIIHADFLKIKPSKFKFEKIIGNIPYYISSEILFRLKEFDFEDAVIMVQDEFAKKMIACPGEKNYGRLSVTSQLFYEIKYISKIPAHLFIPCPKVNSAIIRLKKKKACTDKHMGKQIKQIENIIRILFQHKNKTVRNALYDGGFDKEEIKILEDLLKKRPRELRLDLILEICKKIIIKK